MKLSLPIFILYYSLTSCTIDDHSSSIVLSSDSFIVSISDQGAISSFVDVASGIDYLSQDTSTYLMTLRIGQEFHAPIAALIRSDSIVLDFDNDIKAIIKHDVRDGYLTFELIALDNSDVVDLIIWGPYQTSIYKVIGETVGVVREDEFAIGIQSLNIKTLGGYPWNESDRMPAFDIFSEQEQNNMHPDSDGSVLYRVEAAKPTRYGSSLQAYTRNRDRERVIQDFRHDKIVAPAYQDGGTIGSKIALFGCPVKQALTTIGKIEVAEGLPHPTIDGQWGKLAPEAAAAYIITNFTEESIDKAIDLTKRAGLKYLYHYGKTFESWGHFELYKGEFPNGIAGLRKCVTKAEAEGIMIGTHFLSNFINTNDPYVTPVPDERLAKVGSSVITNTITAKDTDISIASPDYFNQMENNSLKTVMIGEELIRYGQVSKSSPWRLLDCQRGAYGTTAAKHEAGTEISKLLDHAYNVFLTNADLTIEMSERMASLYNKTGLRQISFDGLEGNRSTGLGTYGESLMPYVWYNNLSDDLQEHLIIDASRTTHFFWHIYSRMNWGEPWYGGFRESQTEYRFKNQAYFKRNYMPGMLGWFKMTPSTSIEDVEWLLAHSAGYDAGYAFVADLETVEQNGNAGTILELIGDWEKLRIAGVFTEEQKERMRGSEMEYSLKRINENQWTLSHINVYLFNHKKRVRQPGEPLYSSFEINNDSAEQPFEFILTAVEGEVSNITFDINNYKEVKLPITLKEGHIIKYSGASQAVVYDAEWQKISEIEVNPEDFRLSTGNNSLDVDCDFDERGKSPALKIEVRVASTAERILMDI